MNFSFKAKKSAANRGSLEAFKSQAAHLVGAESVDKITGGALDGCHPIGGRSLIGFDLSRFAAPSISTMSFARM